MAKQLLTEKVTIQISAAQKARIAKAAKKLKISVSEYIRTTLALSLAKA